MVFLTFSIMMSPKFICDVMQRYWYCDIIFVDCSCIRNCCEADLHKWITTLKINFPPPSIHSLVCKNIQIYLYVSSNTAASPQGFCWSHFVTGHHYLMCIKGIWNSHQYMQKLSWSLEMFKAFRISIGLCPEIWVNDNPIRCKRLNVAPAFIISIQGEWV